MLICVILVFMNTILIVKTSAIGDVVQSLGVLEYLHHRFPQSKIDWIVEKPSASFLAAHPYIHQVKVVDTKKWRASPFAKETRIEIQQAIHDIAHHEYDLLFDLQGNFKSGLIDFFCKAKKKIGFSKRCVPETSNLWFTDTHVDIEKDQNISAFYIQMLQTFFEDTSVFHPKGVSLVLPEIERMRLESMAPINPSSIHPVFMVALGSQWPNKQLSDETALKLLHHIHSAYQARFIFIYHGLQEKIRVSRLAESFLDAATIIGNVTLEFLQAFMQKMDGVICADSAALHLAASAGVPTFTVFGPSSARVYNPLGALHIAVQGTCPYNKTFEKRCSRLRSCQTGACIKEVDLSVVFSSFHHFYSSLLALKGDQNRYES